MTSIPAVNSSTNTKVIKNNKKKEVDTQDIFLKTLLTQLQHQTPDSMVSTKDITDTYRGMAQLQASLAQQDAVEKQTKISEERLKISEAQLKNSEAQLKNSEDQLKALLEILKKQA